MVAIGHGNVLAILQVVELRPGTDIEHARNLSSNVLDGDVFVALGSIRAHLKPKQTCCMIDLNSAQDNIVVEHRFRTAGQATVTETVGTILDDDIAVRAIALTLGRIVGPRSLAALHGNSIVVHLHITAMNEHIFHYIEVDGIGRWTFVRIGLSKAEDGDAHNLHACTIIYMCGPEGRILKTNTLDGYILGVGHIDETRALFVLVGALGIPLAAKPERLVILQSITVDGSLAGDGKSVESLYVDQSLEISTCLSLHTGLGKLIVTNEVGALERGTFEQVKMCALLEVNSTRDISASRNNKHTAAIGSNLVNQCLNLLSVDFTIGKDSVVGQFVLFAQRLHIDRR